MLGKEIKKEGDVTKMLGIDEVLEEDKTLTYTLEELSKYQGGNGSFNKEICESAIGFLRSHIDDPSISWDHNLLEYRILLKALDRCGLIEHTSSWGERKEIPNGVLHKSIDVLECLKKGGKIEEGKVKELKTFLSGFKSEYDLFEKSLGNAYRLNGGY
jgi:hypothetical protein